MDLTIFIPPFYINKEISNKVTKRLEEASDEIYQNNIYYLGHSVPLEKNVQVRRIIYDHIRLTNISWGAVKTFNDIQTMNLSFIQGFLSHSPTHYGPLDSESDLIYKHIYNMNRFDFITTGSHPFIKAELFPISKKFYKISR